jgi:hypothetical protein
MYDANYLAGRHRTALKIGICSHLAAYSAAILTCTQNRTPD